MYMYADGCGSHICKCHTHHNWGDCSWCGYLPSLVVVGMKALESLPTSTTVVLKRSKILVNDDNQLSQGQAGHWSNPACHSRSIHCLFRRLTCPNVCQSSRSLKRSVLFRWMIRWRLDWLQKSNMNYVCREHVSEPHRQRQLHTCVQVINKPKILLIPGHVKYMQYITCTVQSTKTTEESAIKYALYIFDIFIFHFQSPTANGVILQANIWHRQCPWWKSHHPYHHSPPYLSSRHMPKTLLVRSLFELPAPGFLTRG